MGEMMPFFSVQLHEQDPQSEINSIVPTFLALVVNLKWHNLSSTIFSNILVMAARAIIFAIIAWRWKTEIFEVSVDC